jgi:hypothetical protein
MPQQVDSGRSRFRRTTGGESQKSFPARCENPVAGGFAVVGDYNANVAMLPLSFPVGALRCSALNSPASAARPKNNSQTIGIAVSKTAHRSQLSANRIATEACLVIATSRKRQIDTHQCGTVVQRDGGWENPLRS